MNFMQDIYQYRAKRRFTSKAIEFYFSLQAVRNRLDGANKKKGGIIWSQKSKH